MQQKPGITASKHAAEEEAGEEGRNSSYRYRGQLLSPVSSTHPPRLGPTSQGGKLIHFTHCCVLNDTCADNQGLLCEKKQYWLHVPCASTSLVHINKKTSIKSDFPAVDVQVQVCGKRICRGGFIFVSWWDKILKEELSKGQGKYPGTWEELQYIPVCTLKYFEN